MDTIQIKDKRFTPFIPEERILKEVARVASEINRDLEGTNPLFLSVLNGAFMFAADLMRNLTIPSEISFVKLASYAGTSSTGKVKELVGLNDDIEGRTVVIVEDIVDTGVTMKHLLETLQARKPKEIRIATLLLKPDKLKVEYSRYKITNTKKRIYIFSTKSFKRMLQITNKQDCCGCYACVQRCPKQCIRMESDEEGFE